MLAAVIRGPTIEAALTEMGKAAPMADLLELRLDCFDEAALAEIRKIVLKAPLPLIFTLRRQEEGGARFIPEKRRLEILERLLELNPAYCDIEADTDPIFIDKIAIRFPNTRLIGSYHDFESTPDDLDAVLQKMQNPNFSVYKLAFMAKSSIDLLRLMAFAKIQSRRVSLSCISMGQLGQPSRILGPIIGNAIDYASMNGDSEMLFQYGLATLHNQFRYRSLNTETEVFALLGNPVIHSRGDFFHNEVFQKENKNAVYVKLRLDCEELPYFSRLIHQLPFKGFSVTMPLKVAIFPFLDSIDPIAFEIGAVNTVSIRSGKMLGNNTDAPGALNAIERHFKVDGKRVVILGAGGSARAIAYEARKRGARVEVFNRSLERAEELGLSLQIEIYHLDEIALRSYDLLINTIPPLKEGELPIASSSIRPNCAVMDIAVWPKETPLLHKAKELGCLCIYGEEMFVEQAKLQQNIWQS